MKNFLKSKQLAATLFSGHYFLHQRTLFSALTFFSLQLADTIINFELILVSREEEYKKRFVKCFLNVCQMSFIYFRHLEILHCSPFFTVSNFLANHWTIFS